jgi:ABC-2 type transport system ATP-binding protein
MDRTIHVHQLSMTYRVPVRQEGLGAALRSLIHRSYRELVAVDEVSFDLHTGEIVGFIGPNGAGKTTTLKMLSGILHPTGGNADILGFQPWKRQPAFLRRIAIIRGSQPIGGPVELTVMDSLRLQQLIYDVDDRAFTRNLGQLDAMLDLGALLDRQIRALSLGERMRCGLALNLIYRPQVLFLDEPTIGMDASVVETTRQFIAAYCQETAATVLLTSHSMADVERLCRRVILLDTGTVRYDGDLRTLSERLVPYKMLRVTLAGGKAADLSRFGDVDEGENGAYEIRVGRRAVPSVTARLLADFPVIDLAVLEPPLERVIDRAYRTGVA